MDVVQRMFSRLIPEGRLSKREMLNSQGLYLVKFTGMRGDKSYMILRMDVEIMFPLIREFRISRSQFKN